MSLWASKLICSTLYSHVKIVKVKITTPNFHIIKSIRQNQKLVAEMRVKSNNWTKTIINRIKESLFVLIPPSVITNQCETRSSSRDCLLVQQHQVAAPLPRVAAACGYSARGTALRMRAARATRTPRTRRTWCVVRTAGRETRRPGSRAPCRDRNRGRTPGPARWQ